MTRLRPKAYGVTRFFLGVLWLSAPFYIVGAFAPLRVGPFGLPISAGMVVAPALVASWLSWQESGVAGLRAIWRGMADLDVGCGLAPRLASIMMMPAVAMLAFAIMAALDLPLPETIRFPVSIFLAAPAFALAALLEEVGWTCFATAPLQERYGVLRAGLMIGAVWALWHIVPWIIIQRHSYAWVAGQALSTVLARVVTGVIYASCPSPLLATIFHFSMNVAYGGFPNEGTHYDPRVVAGILFVVVLLLVCARVARPAQP